jgi:hypothetical protein
MADSDKTLKLLIELGVIGKDDAKAANQLLDETKSKTSDQAKENGVLVVSLEDVEKATRKNNDTVEESTNKFGASRREIRMVGGELGRLVGIGGLGGLALGGIAAAAFGAAKAIEFLQSTWNEVKETIKGPIEVGIPDSMAGHISAAAEAWNEYAEARSKVIAAANSPEADASREEKHLANELKLIKEVLAAEKEKALADLALHKGDMTPEAYRAAEGNIKNIFGEAVTKEEEKNHRQRIANMERESGNLKIDARQKTREALGIKAAPKEVSENNQKTLDENAAKAETAKKVLEERIALISRFTTSIQGGDVPEYMGSLGKIKKLMDEVMVYERYGPLNHSEAMQIEQPRLDQANAQITVARTYRKHETSNSEKKKKLMGEAGTESGHASTLHEDAKTESQLESRQNSTDAQVANLHNAAATQITGASQETIAAVQRALAATLGGFSNITLQFLAHERELERLRQQIENSRNRTRAFT